LNSICKDNAALKLITVQHKKVLFPSTVTCHTLRIKYEMDGTYSTHGMCEKCLQHCNLTSDENKPRGRSCLERKIILKLGLNPLMQSGNYVPVVLTVSNSLICVSGFCMIFTVNSGYFIRQY
jgi:hypothetical protein